MFNFHIMAEPQATAPGGTGDLFSRLKPLLAGKGDILFAIAIVCILFVLIFPLPTLLLDFLLTISIGFSVLILMTVLFINRSLDFSSFPTILLVATMLRLSLNIASTRLILTHGHTGTDASGRVIEAFGKFVMSGEIVIGIIIFIILTIINFVVITKGSGRIAEVSARFSLDAMPGKQMAIDADLSAGLIDEETAKKRRKELEEESTFFGAMDGASKFVRGDAIAGILITFINFVAGIIIGVVQRDMDFSSAAHTYTLLTIGDGLVSQIPALIVSTSAGLLVTKSGVVGSAEKAIVDQLKTHPEAMGLSSALLFFMGVMPGVPFLPFFVLSAITGSISWFLYQQTKQKEVVKVQEAQKAKEVERKVEEPIEASLHLDILKLELGYGLLPLINYQKSQKLVDQIKSLRKQIAKDLGFVMPSVRIQDNMQLPANTYVIRVKDIEAGRGDIRPDMLLVMDPRGGKMTIPGEATTEPTFGLPAIWVSENYREEALFKNYTVVDPPTVITTHITEIIKENIAELLSFSETQKLLEKLGDEHKKLYTDIVPSQITIGGIQRVLQNLLAEMISIRDLPTILEAVAEASKISQNSTTITEHVRSRLARQISHTYTGTDGYISMVTLSPEWEQAFAESLSGKGEERQLAMQPSKLQAFIAKVREVFDKHSMKGDAPVLVTSAIARPYVRAIIERFRPTTIVLSQNEIHPKARLKTLGQI